MDIPLDEVRKIGDSLLNEQRFFLARCLHELADEVERLTLENRQLRRVAETHRSDMQEIRGIAIRCCETRFDS